MNKTILMGRLVRDPETRYTTGNNAMAVTRYTLAIDRMYKKDGEQTADFIPCIAFNKSAEFAEKYFRKGLRVLISGRIQTGSYTNKDGQKVYTTDVIVESQEFADGKQGGETSGNSNYANDDGFMPVSDNMDDDGLPFN